MGAKGAGRRGASRKGAGGGGGAAAEQPKAEQPEAAPTADELRHAIYQAVGQKVPTPAGAGLTPAKMESAFDASPGSRDNFVTLENFRKSLGGTRAEQDLAIREGRLSGKFSLDSHEGLASVATPGMTDAAIYEGPAKYDGFVNPATGQRAASRLIYISRR